jgi:hypothetical protein
VARTILLDTGVVVALINGRDPDHDRCVEVWKELRAKLVSVEGVLVEAAQMLARVPKGPRKAAELMTATKTAIEPVSGARLDRALELIDRYASVPMDLVDASLVAIAEELRIDEILTLDRRGFATYRIRGKTRFKILP